MLLVQELTGRWRLFIETRVVMGKLIDFILGLLAWWWIFLLAIVNAICEWWQKLWKKRKGN